MTNNIPQCSADLKLLNSSPYPVDNVEGILSLYPGESRAVSVPLNRGSLYEPTTSKYLVGEFLKHDDGIFLDIGANIGYFSKLCNMVNPKLEIHAFEAMQKTFEVLKMNMPLCVNIHNHAVGQENKKSTFYVASRDDACSSLVNHPKLFKHSNKVKEEILVDERQISSFDIDFSKVKVIKIDIEGTDYYVMRDLWDLVPSGTLFSVEKTAFTSTGYGIEGFMKKRFLEDFLVRCELNQFYRKP